MKGSGPSTVSAVKITAVCRPKQFIMELSVVPVEMVPPSRNESSNTVGGALGTGVVESSATFLIPLVDCSFAHFQNGLQGTHRVMVLFIPPQPESQTLMQAEEELRTA